MQQGQREGRRQRPARRLPVGLVLLACAWLAGPAWGDDWPQWLGPQRDGIWRETGIVKQFPAGGPKDRWRTPIGGGYAGPAVAGGKVYVTDRLLAPGAGDPKNPFAREAIAGSERVVCLDEKTGKVLWKQEYDCPYRISYPAGPRTTPVVAGGKVYTLGAMGNLLCLDAADGKVLWSKDLPRDLKAPVPLWGYAASPLLDGNRLICLVGGPDRVVVAFDKDSGKELWHALSASETGYAPPVIVETGGTRQLIVWDPAGVYSLTPETGKLYWSQRFPERGQIKVGLAVCMPRYADRLLFITAFYHGSLMLQLDPNQPREKVLWRLGGRSEQPEDTKALHSIMPTPFIKDGYIYGVGSYGELRCLKADTGERIWMTRAPTSGGPPVRWANAFLVEQGNRFFLFNEKGDLIIARLTPKGYDEVGRAHIIDPTNRMPGRLVVWSHPAFANRCVFARNDREIVCVPLAAAGNR